MSQCGALYASSWRYGFISEDSQWEGGSLEGDGGGVKREGYNWRRKVAGRRKGGCSVTKRREGGLQLEKGEISFALMKLIGLQRTFVLTFI